MEITVSVSDFGSLSQSELILQNLFSTVSIGSTCHSSRSVIIRDARFRSGTVENPLVLTLKNSRTETVMYVRSIPIASVFHKGGLKEQWVAIYPPGDPQNFHFDVAAKPKASCPQVCISISIVEDIMSTAGSFQRPSLGESFDPEPRLTSESHSPFELVPRQSTEVPRDSLAPPRASVSVDSTVREKEIQAQRIKEQVAEFASAQRRAHDAERLLQDSLRIFEDMKRQLEGLEGQISEQRVAIQLLEKDEALLQVEETQLKEQIQQREVVFQELRDRRDELDRELSRTLDEGERQKKAMEASSIEFAAQTQSMLEDIDRSSKLVAQLTGSLEQKTKQAEEREEKMRETELERAAKEDADRETLTIELDRTLTAVANARIRFEEAQRNHHAMEMEHQKTKAALAGVESEVRSLSSAVDDLQRGDGDDPSSGGLASGTKFLSDAKTDLDQKREKLGSHAARMQRLEAELSGNREQVERLSGRIAELHTETREREVVAKRFQDEQADLQNRFELQRHELVERAARLEQDEERLNCMEQAARTTADRTAKAAERTDLLRDRIGKLEQEQSSRSALIQDAQKELASDEMALDVARSEFAEKTRELSLLHTQRVNNDEKTAKLELIGSEIEEEIRRTTTTLDAERPATSELKVIEERRQRLFEEDQLEEATFHETLRSSERASEDAFNEMRKRAADSTRKKDEEIRNQLQQVTRLETERENLMNQVSALDQERREMEDFLRERERVHEGLVSSSEQKARDCGAMEESIRQLKATSAQLRAEQGSLEMQVSEASHEEVGLRNESVIISERIQVLRSEMEDATSKADADAASEAERSNTLQALCLAERKEAEACQAASAGLELAVQESHASCRRLESEEEELQSQLADTHKPNKPEKVLPNCQEGPGDVDAGSAHSDNSVRRRVRGFEVSLNTLSDKLSLDQEHVRRLRAEEEEMGREMRRLKERMKSTGEQMAHQIEHSNLQFETIQKLEEQKLRFEREVEVLTLGLHDAEQRNLCIQRENEQMQQQIESLFDGSLQDWAAEVQRVKAEAEIQRYKGEIDVWRARVEEVRKERQQELAGLQQQHDDAAQTIRNRIAVVEADMEWMEQTKLKRSVAVAKRQERETSPVSNSAMPGLVVPQRPLPTNHHRRKALLIGINYTDSHAPLKGCVNDLWNMQCLLRHTLQYRDDQMRVLTECVDGRVQKPERAPTKANIQLGLQWLVNEAMPGDSVLLIFSGYGAQHPTAPGSAHHEGYVVPLDFAADLPTSFFEKGGDDLVAETSSSYRLLPLAEITYYMAKLPALCKASIMMDCCYGYLPSVGLPHGGIATFNKVCRGQVDYSALRDFISRPRFLELPVLPVTHTPAYVRTTGPVACWLHCFLGSKHEEWSAEFPIEGTVQGAFSWAFLKAMAQGHFHCGLYQFQKALTDILGDLRVHFRGLEQTPVLQLSPSASMQDVVFWT